MATIFKAHEAQTARSLLPLPDPRFGRQCLLRRCLLDEVGSTEGRQQEQQNHGNDGVRFYRRDSRMVAYFLRDSNDLKVS